MLSTAERSFASREKVAEAFATVAQFKQKRKIMSSKKPGSSSSAASSQSYPFKAQGDIQFDNKSKENKKNAIRFLKSMSTCTSCNRRGHWVGDQECPNYKLKGKGKGKQKKKGSPKKVSQAFFVLHDSIESADENEVSFAMAGPSRRTEPNAAPVNDLAPKNVQISDTSEVLQYANPLADENTLDDGAKLADEKAKKEQWQRPRGHGHAPGSPAPSDGTEWQLVHDQPAGYPRQPAKIATIVRQPETQCWLYGVLLSPGVALPPLPELGKDDLDVLQPLPNDTTQMTEGPFMGHTFAGIASSKESEPYCKQVVYCALNNEPMSPCVFRLAYYLHARIEVAWRKGLQISGTVAPASSSKRSMSSNDMITSRVIQVPLQLDYHDPSSISIQECEVMMVDDFNVDVYAGNEDEYDAYETEDISPKPLPSDAASSDGLDPDTRREQADAFAVAMGLGDLSQDLPDHRDDDG
eukprot:Skav201036  [mRNA]  locus=scaffold3386:181094:187063:- [translate_table: standard]